MEITIIENELKNIWNDSQDLLKTSLERKSHKGIVKTDGLARFDDFFRKHCETVKNFLSEKLKKITDIQEQFLEGLYDDLIQFVQNCLPEKSLYNKLQKTKYKEMILVFLQCFTKWKIVDFQS